MNISSKKIWVGLGVAGVIFISILLACTPPDEEPPTVDITSPEDGEQVSGYVTITGEAVDEDSVASITLIIDDTEIETFNAASFTYEWHTLDLPDSSEHVIRATSLDPAGNEGESDPVTVTLDHGSERPGIPPAPDGPSQGYVDEALTFTATTTDPNGDSVAFQFDWGDGSDLMWTDFVASGDTVSVQKTYEEDGIYAVKVKAKDVNGAQSEYSSELDVTITVPTTVGAVEVRSTPAGAEIWVDGENTGLTTTSIIGNLDATSYTIALRLEGYEDWDTTVTVIADDTIEVVAELSQVGQLVWRFQTGDAVNSSPAIATSASFLAGEVIYIGSADDNIYAVDEEGNELWEYPTELDVNSVPMVGDNGKVYFGSSDVYVYGLHPEGIQYWLKKTDGAVISSPAYSSGGTIYIGSNDNNLWAFTEDGDFLWKFLTGGSVSSSPAIGSDGTIYVGSEDGYLYAVNSSGQQVWSRQTGNKVTSSPAIDAEGNIYFGSQDSYIYALNPDGSQKWSYLTGGKVASSPVIGPDGTIYCGSDDNYLYALNPDGSLAWSFETGLWIRSSPAVDSDGTVYFGSLDGWVYALRSDGTLKWKYETGDPVNSSPAIGDDGTIYIGSTDGYLYALSGGSEGLASSPWPKFGHDNANTGRY